MKFFAVLCAGAFIASTPASAQDAVMALNPTLMAGWSGSVNTNRDTGRDFGTRFNTRSRPLPSRPRPAAVTALGFQPDRAVQQQVYARAIAHAQKVSPGDAPTIKRMLLSGEVHRNAAAYLGRYGMSPSNLADTLTLHLAGAWLATRANTADPSRAQMLGLRNQVAAALADTPSFAQASNSTKQEIAEANIVQATFNGSVAMAAARDPKIAALARQTVARDIMSNYHIDLMRVNLTPAGFQ